MSNYEILTGEELYEQELNTERRVKPLKTVMKTVKRIRNGSQRYYTMGGFEQLRFWQPPQPYMQFVKAIL